mgnify:FL=1
MDKIKLFFKKIIRIIVRSVIRVYFIVVYRVRVLGRENLPKDKKEPLIFCGNHRTYNDPPLIVVTAKRHVRFLAKEELKKNKLFAFLGVIFDGIYVKRDSKDLTAIKTTLKALKNGESIALFPEGTRHGIEKGQKAKDGAAFFAERTGARIIPVGISGGEKPFKQMTIRYGKPLDFSNRNKDELDEITEEIMNEIIKLTK